MKALKKTLILASTVALGFTLAGCSKKNLLIQENYAQINHLDDKTFTELKSFEKEFELTVKYYNRIGDNLIWYISQTDEYVIYDINAKKEIYKTTDKIRSVSSSSNSYLLYVTFDDTDRSQMLLATNGDIIVEKGVYLRLTIGDTKSTIIDKKDVYSEICFSVNYIKQGEEFTTIYKKIVVPQKKNEKGKAVGVDYDKTKVTITDATKEDLIKIKKGEEFDFGNDYYEYQTYGNKVVINNRGAHEIIFSLDYASSSTAKVMLGSKKAIVQICKSTTSYNIYDVKDGNDLYIVDTYEVCLNDGSYKKLDNYEYFFKDANFTSINSGKNVLVLEAKLVKGNIVVDSRNFITDGNCKVVQDSAKLIYDEFDYFDLENGYYLEDYGSDKVYFTDKNGEIKKVYFGTSLILGKAKVVILFHKDEPRFSILDFKGNPICEETYKYSNHEDFSFDGTELFYIDANTGDSHIMKFEKGKIVSNEVVDYTYQYYYSGDKQLSNVAEKTRYYYYDRTYALAELLDTNGDTTYDAFNFTYYDLFTNEEIGKVEAATRIYTTSCYDVDGKYAIYNYAISNVETDSYTITVYKLS